MRTRAARPTILAQTRAPGIRRARAFARDLSSSLCAAQHVDMQDAVFLVRVGNGAKAELGVEALEPLLRGDPHRHSGIELRAAPEAFAHRLAPESRAAQRGDGEHATDRRLAVFVPGLDQAQICAER